MAVTRDQFKLVEAWFTKIWDEHIQFVIDTAKNNQRPSTADLKQRREFVEEARAALAEVRVRHERP